MLFMLTDFSARADIVFGCFWKYVTICQKKTDRSFVLVTDN